jgi:hypothetical protein
VDAYLTAQFHLQQMKVSIYINGILQVSLSTPYSPMNVVRNQNLIGGRTVRAGNDDLIAYLDDLRIYNRALSSAEILNDMNL